MQAQPNHNFLSALTLYTVLLLLVACRLPISPLAQLWNYHVNEGLALQQALVQLFLQGKPP